MYFIFLKKHFQRNLQFRMNHFINNIASIVFCYAYISIWEAVLSSKTTLSFISYKEASTYVIINQGLLWLVTFFPKGCLIPEKVRSGNIIGDLYKPINFYLMNLASMTGHILYNFLFRTMIIVLSLSILFGIYLPANYLITLYFFVSCLLGFIIGFNINFFIGICAFKFIDIEGLHKLLFSINTLFSGFFIPIEVFPFFLQKITLNLPFVGLNYIPTAIYLNFNTYTINQLLSRQLIWALILTIINVILSKRSIKNLMIQGG